MTHYTSVVALPPRFSVPAVSWRALHIVKPIFDSQKGDFFEESSIHAGLRAMCFSKNQNVVQLFLVLRRFT